jgi:aminopeptidase N
MAVEISAGITRITPIARIARITRITPIARIARMARRQLTKSSGTGLWRLWARAAMFAGGFWMLAGCTPAEPEGGAGVSRELAADRTARISEVRYSLTFRIPRDRGEPVTGTSTLQFTLKEPSRGVTLDFQVPEDHLQQVRSQNRPIQVQFRQGRIEIPAEVLADGRNTLDFSFRSADTALNRQADYLYTLFVPDRASTAFPCFDQPDLKARYRLALNLPAGWVPLSNSAAVHSVDIAGRTVVSFRETEPLSTYQFAFAAGAFSVVERTVAERTVRLVHRESDSAKLQRNLDAIFHWHGRSLSGMERYTGIAYPYQKFDFLLVPGFQFGGMEHPGAVYYRDGALLLEASATPQDELDRAHLIAHETAHMWFGNLVTMRWFDDVWMKEVFANFMAARIVDPDFPGLNHEVAFFLGHHPAAAEVDRSRGTHPIRQELANLSQAADLYGPIIYQKAPIVMRQLEDRLGPDRLRQGLAAYLQRYSGGNADWTDLVTLLDGLTDEDLTAWSRAWVETAGRPEIRIGPSPSPAGIRVQAVDPQNAGRIWPQRLRVAVYGPDGTRTQDVQLVDAAPQVIPFPVPDGALVVGNSDGMAYGRIVPDPVYLEGLIAGLDKVRDPVARSVACLTLLEAVLHRELPAGLALEKLIDQLQREQEARLLQFQLDLAGTLFWRLLDREARSRLAEPLERVLLERISSGDPPGVRLSALRALVSVASTPGTLRQVERWWSGEDQPAGIELGETDLTRMAQELALRSSDGGRALLERQLERITDPERRERLLFLLPALSPDPATRLEYLRKCLDTVNRPKETWVLDGLRWVHHPLRAASTEELLPPSLEPLEEVHRRGSIFFAKRWLDAVLWGYTSESAARVVEQFLADHPSLPERLRQKVLQAADYLERTSGWGQPDRP